MDTTVYRGIQSGKGEIDTDMPAKGTFISTTLSLLNAQLFNDRGCLFQLQIPKGTPVLYSPYIISVNMESNELIFAIRDEEVEIEENEIILNRKNMQKITNKKVSTYGVFEYKKDSTRRVLERHVIEGEMEPIEKSVPSEKESIEER